MDWEINSISLFRSFKKPERDRADVKEEHRNSLDEKFEASQSPSSDGSEQQSHCGTATTADYMNAEMNQNNASTNGVNHASRDVTDAAHAQKSGSGSSPHEGATAPQLDLHMNGSMAPNSRASPHSDPRDARFTPHMPASQRLYPDQRGPSPASGTHAHESDANSSYAVGQPQYPPMPSYSDRFCAANGYSSPHVGFNSASPASYSSDAASGAFKQTPPPPASLASELYSNSLHRSYMTPPSPFIPRHYPPLPPQDAPTSHAHSGEAGSGSNSGYPAPSSTHDPHNTPASLPSAVKPEFSWYSMPRAAALAVANGFNSPMAPSPGLMNQQDSSNAPKMYEKPSSSSAGATAPVAASVAASALGKFPPGAPPTFPVGGPLVPPQPYDFPKYSLWSLVSLTRVCVLCSASDTLSCFYVVLLFVETSLVFSWFHVCNYEMRVCTRTRTSRGSKTMSN